MAILIALVIGGIAAWFFLGGAAAAKSAKAGSTTGDLQSRRDTLTYSPPRGQDPAVVVAALKNAGFLAEPHPGGNTGRVVIAWPDGVQHDRERVREVLASADSTAVDDGAPTHPEVLFDDEPGGRPQHP